MGGGGFQSFRGGCNLQGPLVQDLPSDPRRVRCQIQLKIPEELNAKSKWLRDPQFC